MKAILDWAKAEGGEKEKEISPALQEIAGTAQLADEQVNQSSPKWKPPESRATSKPATPCAPS